MLRFITKNKNYSGSTFHARFGRLNVRKILFMGLLTVGIISLSAEERQSLPLGEQSVSRNSISYSVEGDISAEDQPVFKLRLNTHSVDLDFDIRESVFLIDKDGWEIEALSWNGSPQGGHHRSGILTFPALYGFEDEVVLVIRAGGQLDEVRFSWEVER